MENNAFSQPQSSMPLPEGIRHHLVGSTLADDDGAIRIVAASAQNWPEVASLGVAEITLGEDGLIRLALWSVSTCCAALLGARRAALLLPQDHGAWEIRCLVTANANLATQRPLCGFLLKPFETFDRRASRRARGPQGAGRTPKDNQNRASETRLALFDAFPVEDDGENALPGGARTP